jgi:methyl-accepting chemotaxis protein
MVLRQRLESHGAVKHPADSVKPPAADLVRRPQGGSGMEPVSIAVAALALLAYKGGEAFADEAGRATWRQLTSLTSLIRGRLSKDSGDLTALRQLEEDPSEPANVIKLGMALQRHIDRDEEFDLELKRLAKELFVTSSRADRLHQQLREIADEVQKVMRSSSPRLPGAKKSRVDSERPESVGAPALPYVGGAMSLAEAVSHLRYLANEGIPLQHAVALVNQLQTSAAQLASHVDGLSSETLENAYALLKEAEELAEQARSAIVAAQEKIQEAVARFSG